MTRGFTFNGVHSSHFHIICDPASRQLLPEKRRQLVAVPGRSGSYHQDEGAYNDRSETFTCYYTRAAGSDTATQAREIAAWLSENGVLSFDNEPDKFYNAFFSGAPPLSKHLAYGQFDLTFTYSPPFAYTAQQSVRQIVTGEADQIVLPVAGTAPTPCRIIIESAGNTVIRNLRITHHK